MASRARCFGPPRAVSTPSRGAPTGPRTPKSTAHSTIRCEVIARFLRRHVRSLPQMTRSTSLAAPALLAAAALAGCGSSDRDASTGSNAKPAATTAVAAVADLPPGRFAFRRFLDDAQTHGAIYTINTDGTGDHQITEPPAGAVDDQPDWAPDGTRLAFERCNDERGCIVMTVRATGGDPQQGELRWRPRGGGGAGAPPRVAQRPPPLPPAPGRRE